LTDLTLTTGRYQTWRPVFGVPIRATVGEPKFWRGPELVVIRALAPFGIFGRGLTHDEARRRYLARLDRQAETILAALTDVARKHPGRQLCVLCFEDVHAGQVCHRRWFAEWFEQRYGVQVPEVDVDQQPL
jgi:hypothetical protein